MVEPIYRSKMRPSFHKLSLPVIKVILVVMAIIFIALSPVLMTYSAFQDYARSGGLADYWNGVVRCLFGRLYK